ncbi:hypothetical protein ACFQ0Q_40955 [Streptomyces aureus]
MRSPQPIAEAGQKGPTSFVQLIFPVAESRPYTLAFSVAATTVLPATSGWA